MITFVAPYYENGSMLERHLEEWCAYSPEVAKQFRAIIVDDCSAEDPAASHLTQDNLAFVCCPVEIAFFRMLPPKWKWYSTGAKNLAMRHALNDWALVTDIDHLLPASEAEKLIALKLDPAKFYVPIRYNVAGEVVTDSKGVEKPFHPNTFLLHKSLYWMDLEMTKGGFDEDFRGYWGGSGPFRAMLTQIRGAEEVHTTDFHMVHYGRSDIPDASTRGYGRAKSPDDWRNNPLVNEKVRRGAYVPVNPIRFEWERVL